MKTPLFMDRVLIFPFPSTKTAISMDNKKPSAKLEFPCFATGIIFFILNVAIAGYYQSVEQESKRYCSGISRLKVLHNNRTS